MNELIPFDYWGRQIRVILNEKNEPEWVAKDVVEGLGNVWNGASRIAHVPDEWKGSTSVVTPGGMQDMVTLSEPRLYFYCNRSNSPYVLVFLSVTPIL